jgi:hypothetical protein
VVGFQVASRHNPAGVANQSMSGYLSKGNNCCGRLHNGDRLLTVSSIDTNTNVASNYRVYWKHVLVILFIYETYQTRRWIKI